MKDKIDTRKGKKMQKVWPTLKKKKINKKQSQTEVKSFSPDWMTCLYFNQAEQVSF